MHATTAEFKIVHSISVGNSGGAQLSMEELIRNLDQNLFQNLFLCGLEGDFSRRQLKDVERVSDISFHESWLRLSRSNFWNASLFCAVPHVVSDIFRFSAALKASKPDVVCTNDVKSHVIIGCAARLAGIPVLWHLRERCPKFERVLALMSKVIPTTVVGNSKATLQAVSRDGCQDNVVYNGIDVGRFRTSAHDRLAARREFALEDSDIVVGCLGQLSPLKGHLVLVEALSSVVSENRHVVLLLGGDEVYFTSGEHVGVKQRIGDLASRLGLSSRVRLVGQQDNVPRFLAAVDIFAQPSLHEGFGRTCAEAMAMGLPVVASRTGGLPELVAEGETGILVEPGDPEELAQALIGLSRDEQLRSRLGAAGRARVEKFFKLQSYVSGMATQILNTIRQGQSRHKSRLASERRTADDRTDPSRVAQLSGKG